MTRSLQQRLRERHRIAQVDAVDAVDAGFTLIELMVVLLIMGILLAIAIPTFLGVQGTAQDKSAQSNDANAILNLSAYYGQNQTYAQGGYVAGALATSEQTSEPALGWIGGATAISNGNCPGGTTTNCVSVDSVNVTTSGSDEEGVVVASLSKDGICWYMANLQANSNATAVGGAAPYSWVGIGTANTTAKDQFVNGNATAVTNAGEYYAEMKSGSANSCEADIPFTSTDKFNWETGGFGNITGTTAGTNGYNS